MMRKFKKILAFFVCMIMSAMVVLPIIAETVAYGFDTIHIYDFNGGILDNDSEDNPEENDPEEDPKEDPEDEGYSIECNTDAVSFGTIVIGEPVDSQCIDISNTGNRDVSLIWKDVDPDNAFYIDVTQAQTIRAGETADVHVSLTTNKGAGSYSAVLQFADESDPSYSKGVKVNLSVTIIDTPSKINRVTLNPGSVSTTPGSSVDFYAEVEGEGDFSKEVSYSVNGNASADTKIDANGHLNIAGNEGDKTIYVMAVSKEDTSKSDKVAVEIKSNVFAVNISSYPNEGGNVTGAGTYKQGATVTLTASPKNGWVFEGWSINGDEVGGSTTYTIDNISENVNAVAYFNQNLIRVKTETNHDHMGSVNGDFYVSKGESVTLEAFPEDGYKFSCWMEGKKKISSDKKYTVKNITKPRTFKAIFVKSKCVVKVATCDETMGKVSGGKEIKSGEDVTIKASPNAGYNFVKWICNDQKISDYSEYTLKDVTDDITLVAIFEPAEQKIKKAKITAGTVDNNGVIAPSGEIVLEEGKNINFTITPKSGYQIAAVAVDGKQIGVQSSFTISNVHGDHNVVAAFLPIQNTGKPSDDDQKKTTEEAINSDINKELSIETKKRYEENIMDMDDAPESLPSEKSKDDMDNSLDEAEGLQQILNMTDEETEAAIEGNGKLSLVETAVLSEALEVNVSNTMRKEQMPIAYSGEELNNPEVKNFTEIICDLFTDDELKQLVSGEGNVSVSITVAGADSNHVPQKQQDIISSSLSEEDVVGKYFFTSFVKTVDGVSSVVSELSKPIMVKVDIPDDIYSANRTYSIARVHYKGMGESEVSILDDIDNDPNTITFETDRFSTYAIVYKNLNGAGSIANIATDSAGSKTIIMIVGFAVVLFATIAIVVFNMNGRKKSRKRR